MFKKIINILYIILLWLLILSFLTIDLNNIFNFNQFFWYAIFAYLFFVIISYISWLNKNNKELKEFNIFIITFWILSIFWLFIWNIFINSINPGENELIRVTWKLAFLFLSLALIITPLSTMFWLEHKNKFIFIRKVLGIITFLFFIVHFFHYLEEETYSYFWDLSLLAYILKNLAVRYDAIIWIFAWIIMIILWVTSNKLSQKILWKAWKWLHYLVYPMFLISMLHIAFAWRFDSYYAWLFIVVVSMRFFVYLKDIDKLNTNNWKTTKYICVVCWYIYDENKWDPDWWLPAWTKYEDIPDDWICPICWVSKKDFIPYYDNEENLNAEIIKINYLTKDVIELIIKSEKVLKYDYGQFMKLIFSDFDWEFTRQYSIAKNKENEYTFIIKLNSKWRAGKLIPSIKIWDKIKIWWVFWEFKINKTNNKKIFIATWTWLAPIYSMLNSLSDNIEKELYFWVATEKDLFYIEELNKIKKLKINYYLSKEENNKYNKWRINIKNIEFNKENEFYICWNPIMTEEIKNDLKTKGYENIYFEKFI